MDWLSEAERVMKSSMKAPISVIPEKVYQRITEHAVSGRSPVVE